MQQLVKIITTQIELITIPSIKSWLFSHLNPAANNMNELFCKQIPAEGERATKPQPTRFDFPRHLAIIPIFYTFAPDLLREQLLEKLQQFPQLLEEPETVDQMNACNDLHDHLAEMKKAWSIIAELQRQGPNELIQILNKADKRSLDALAHWNKDINFKALLDLFLIKNSKDLEAINRYQIISFLRHADFNGWFARYLASLIQQATDVLSFRLLFLTFSSGMDELEKLVELRACINSYPFSIQSEALWAVCRYYQRQLQEDLFSPVSAAFVLLVHDVLKKMVLEQQIAFLKGINHEHYLLIVAFCLKQSTDGKAEERQNYLELLFLLCSEYAVADKKLLGLITTRLLQHDAYLFATPNTQTLSQKILLELKKSNDSDVETCWIEQLISSPDYIAASSVQGLQFLIDRYALYCSSLSPMEFGQLIFSSSDSGMASRGLQNHLQRVNQQILNRSEGLDAWLAKRNQLIKIGIDTRINQLLSQVEAQCIQNNTLDVRIKNQALKVLYTYFDHIFSDLRFDLLVRAIESSYRDAKGDDGVLESEFNGLLPHFNSVFPPIQGIEKELKRQQEVVLYNVAGQQIGFVSEANKAITYVEDEPVLLNSLGLSANNEPVYDNSSRIIGYLTGAGQINSVAGFQRAFCPRLLATLPHTELDYSPAGLDMIIRHMLFDNSLDELYQYEEVARTLEKRQWLERRISSTIQRLTKELDATVFKSLARHFNDEAVFSLLAGMQYQANALHLFHAIIGHRQRREQFFTGLYTSDVQQFLANHHVVSCLAEYMPKYYNKRWFAEGLLPFAHYGKKYQFEHLLSDTLAVLYEDARPCIVGRKQFDAVLGKLINSGSCASIVLKDFLQDNCVTAVQQVKSPELSKVTQYFNKEHLTTVIHHLNRSSYWEESAQYKLLLHILDKQHARIFVTEHSPDATKSTWDANELNELSRFIKRHLGKKRHLDIEWSIGYRVLGELIFRNARHGLVSLFYSKKTFNESLARLSFTRTYLERLIDKFWIPDHLKEQISEEALRLRTWFRGTHSANMPGQMLQDWRFLVHQTWSEISQKKLPMICAYLLNYSGQKEPLQLLLQDYIKAFQNKAEYLHPVSKLLRQFPQREVSFVVFDALEAVIIKNPSILDLTLLRDMAGFYAKSILNQEISPDDAELSLLTYLGQNKHYELVKKGCKILADVCSDKALKRQLKRGAKEAEVEGDLYSSPRQFFFELIKTLKRLWHYGVFTDENASKIVKFCDDVSPGPVRKYAAADINVPMVNRSADSNSLSFDVKRKQLIGLLDEVKRSSVIKTLDGYPSKTKQILFGCTPLSVGEQVVASQQDVITI